MSYAKALSKNLVKPSVEFKTLPNEKILFIIDSFALTKLDIDFSPTNLESMSSLAIIQRACRFFALQKNRYQNNSFAICILTPHSYKFILDFTSNINIIVEKLSSILIQNEKPEEVAAYDFGPLLKFVAELRNMHKDSVFRVIMTYNRDDCLPIIESLDKNTYSIFCSPTFYFDTVYICENNIDNDEMAQTIYGMLALLCNTWSYKVCVQRKPIAIINGIASLLPHPHARELTSK
ncbi:uncharacterized protein LOC112684953 [Sipha flava]|jgi:hypothetical protein|uniref:Uncharacterized protein LOC112684953 n=1 Tax=Sipha flava TaxID=143950 RepID=A0A2S2PYK1_9HEMI|nr:uncharacterized protein LOC112684953 [Sipha flava]XP_025412579.1 uncharacterized protein LOC112684953 [Sipha flava]XP_025412651.1 uncharacterized protein LOC112684953 [Sipha flava]